MVRQYTHRADPEHVRAVRQAAARRRWIGTTAEQRREVARKGGEAARSRAALAARLLAEHREANDGTAA
ncbi:hypothetical protein ADK67_40300 [Saccharothrix sp. NRRL B-16348]|uniref:hypothetical protein n=1 Tax=Saccharothrix sp. NRRL B-16348 TaxID=1415542 RepID=UPI0006AF938A|nr:hypothetical protein [Saccharothrix sp. NRRL B-16348]KOX16197.1 hypothetical protein ADK67_40300 [Saccharothrix sp. NRRL B-16348]